MRKIFIILVILFLASYPVWAGAVFEGGLSGAALGAVVGGVPGAIIGAIGGAVLGGVKEVGEEKTKKETYNAQIASLKTANKELEYKNANLNTAINAWQTNYDAQLGSFVEQGEAELKSRKESWGLTNAALASREQGGITAQLLSQEAKQRVITYAGEDMTLNSASAEKAVADAYSGADTSSLATLSNNKNYGIYERSLVDTITTLRQNKKTLEDQVAINEEAINTNKDTIKRYKGLKDDLFFNKYGGLV